MPDAGNSKKRRKKRLKWSNLYTFSCLSHSHKDEASLSLGGEDYSRVVYINDLKENNAQYPSNWVSTTKYSLLTFLPKALFEQFRRVANLYFLLGAAVSVTPLSPFSALSLIAPLVFVVGVSMVKEAIEDWHRYLQVCTASIPALVLKCMHPFTYAYRHILISISMSMFYIRIHEYRT